MARLLAYRNFLGAALLVVGCSSDGLLDPSEIDPSESYEGWFQMTRLDDRPLPLMESNEGQCQVVYLGGWIELNRDGTFRMQYDRTSKLCDGPAHSGWFNTMRGTYSISGEQIRFEGDRGEPTLTGIYRSYQRLNENHARIGTIEFELRSRSYTFYDVKSETP